MKYEVEIYGHPGAGKTVLLTALYHFFNQAGIKIHHSGGLETQANRIYMGQNLVRTPEGVNPEYLSFDLATPKISVTVTAHAGEEHTATENVTATIKRPFVTHGNNKLLVIVVNPFLHDTDLAWKAFRNLVAYLQHQIRGNEGVPISIKEACYTAVKILFHYEREAFSKIAHGVEEILEVVEKAILKYDCWAADLAPSFRLENVSSADATRFNEVFQQAIDNIIHLHQGKVYRLQNLIAGFDNSMLVLSHVDLANNLNAIKIDDFDEVFNRLFGTLNRGYRQQLLAKNLKLKVFLEDGQLEIRPVGLLEKTASQFYENIKSFAIQNSTSQPQSSNNSQSGLLWLFMTMILIASVFLVFQIGRLENQLNNEVIASNIASKVPDALKDQKVTTEIIKQLNLNKVEIDEEKLSELIATKLSSPKSDFIAQLAEKTADKMPAIESEKVTNAIAANLADTHGKAVEQVTKDEIATALANKLYAENKKTLIKQLNALKVSVAERVANKIDLEGTTIVVQDIVDKLVEQFNHKLDTEQFRIALKLAGKFEEIGDDGTWKKLKLASNNGEFISCPNKKGEGKWVESDKERYDQYDKKMYYCSGDGKNVTIYESISSKSLEQFGITIDEKGNLYYSPK
jgi:uncharacterized protein YeaO (DUF488 family)